MVGEIDGTSVIEHRQMNASLNGLSQLNVCWLLVKIMILSLGCHQGTSQPHISSHSPSDNTPTMHLCFAYWLLEEIWYCHLVATKVHLNPIFLHKSPQTIIPSCTSALPAGYLQKYDIVNRLYISTSYSFTQSLREYSHHAPLLYLLVTWRLWYCQ